MSNADTDNLRSMVHAFRMSELQTLMIFAGRSKTGRKVDLVERAENLVKLNSPDIALKIKELSAAMYKSLGATNSSSAGGSSTSRAGVTYSNPYTDPIPTEVTPSSNSSHQLIYPTYPDVTLKKLPFYKIEESLLKPCSLQPNGNARFQEQNFTFYLTPTQASDISNSSYRNSQGRPEYRKQIQMRFSLLETSCEQEDNFPSSICVKINGKLCPLPNPIPTNQPNTEPKRPSKPINITPLCNLSATTANYINVSWAVETARAHTVSVYQVDNLTYTDLLAQLKAKGQRQPDYTKALIKEKLADQDQEIATTSCKVTLACPLGKMRMDTPCRASTCDHLQCFDAKLYLMMNEKKPKWTCPVCNKPALMENLLVDGFFIELVNSSRLPPDEHEIVLHNDGSWDPLPPKIPDHLRIETIHKPKKPVPCSSRVTTFSLDSDGESEGKKNQSNVSDYKKGTNKSEVEVDCITLDSDSDEEEKARQPQPKKARLLQAASPALTISSNASPQRSSSPVIICLDDD